MRMMQMPNGPAVEPQSWVPRDVGRATSTLNMKLTDAFDNVGPLFDAIQDHEDAWKNTLEGWQNDPYGPQVDVRKEFIENMGNRVTVMSSYDTPITEDSERAVFAIEAKNEKALAKTLEKWMTNEPDVEAPRSWPVRHLGARAEGQAVEEPEVECPGFTHDSHRQRRDGRQRKKKERERVLPNSAVTVALGHLMMASDIELPDRDPAGFRPARAAGEQRRLPADARRS